jgi:hypothetical protein
VNLKNLEAVDYELFKGLTWMLCLLALRHRENNMTSVLDETFSVVEDRFGEHVVVESSSGRAATQDMTGEQSRVRRSRRSAPDRQVHHGGVTRWPPGLLRLLYCLMGYSL